MKVTVFGGSGFLGGHVVQALLEAGHSVTVFDKRLPASRAPRLKALVGDVADEKAVAAAVRGARAVYNFAGIADIQEAHEDPLGTVRANVLGNCAILEACAKARVKRYIFASTLYVYSRAGSFYAASKQACEAYIENYQRYRGVDFTILRYGSLYGAGAGRTNTVSRLLREALTGKAMEYEGDGEETREYIHVDDAARFSVEVLAPEYKNQNILIAGHQAIRVRELMEMIAEISGRSVKLRFKRRDPNKTLDTHYERTPYSFTPRLGRRLIGRQYIDLGQGLLRLIDEIHAEVEAGARR